MMDEIVKKNKLITMAQIGGRTGFRCSSMIPCAKNPRKRTVKEYNSRGIIFSSREQVVEVANAMLALAYRKEMDNDEALLSLTAMCNKENKKGFALSVTLQPLKKKGNNK